MNALPAGSRAGGAALEIALVVNAAGPAFAAGARMFGQAVRAAAGESCRLHIATIRDGEPAAASPRVIPFEQLAARTRLDGVIVTGAEPTRPDLQHEPYWPRLVGLFEWAQRRQVPLLVSCLAAHAAVLHADGIRRRRLTRKAFGLFRQDVVADDPLTAGLGPHHAPHSRWNELDRQDLLAHGYSVLTESAQAGVDMFVRRRENLVLFLQGHPEYEPGTLAGEFRRDVVRFLQANQTFPDLPAFMLEPRRYAALEDYRLRALRDPASVAASELAALLDPSGLPDWSASARLIVGNWLDQAAGRSLELASVLQSSAAV